MKYIDLDRLHPKFIKSIEAYQRNHDDLPQSQLADLIGLQASHLNALIKRNRKLSAYYLEYFLKGGIMSLSDLYDREPEDPIEKEWYQLAKEMEEDREIIKLLKEAKAKGIPIERFIKTLIESDFKPN